MLLLTLLLGCDTGTPSSTDTADTGLDETADAFGGQEGEEVSSGNDTAETETDISISSDSDSLSFGPQSIGCSREATLQLTNSGAVATSVSAIELSVVGELADATELRLDEALTLPLLVDPGTSVPVTVVYAPLDEAEDLLTVQVFTDDPSDPSLTVEGDGSGVVFARGSEAFSSDGTSAQFALSAAAVAGTLVVLIEGAPLSDDAWSFSAEDSTVSLRDIPEIGLTVAIEYAITPPSCD